MSEDEFKFSEQSDRFDTDALHMGSESRERVSLGSLCKHLSLGKFRLGKAALMLIPVFCDVPVDLLFLIRAVMSG